MKKSPRVSPALLLVGVALLVVVGVWLASAWLNGTTPPPDFVPNTSAALRPSPIASFTSSIISTYTTVLTITETVVGPTYEYTTLVSAYTPVPTFDISFVPTVAPLEDWETYADVVGGYTFRYPKGWIIRDIPPATRQTLLTYSLSIGNYRGDDPIIMNLPKGPFPPQLKKMDLAIEKPGASPLPILPGESLEAWAKRTHGRVEDWVESGYINIDRITAYRVLWHFPQGVNRGVSIYIQKDERMVFFEYYPDPRNPGWSKTAEEIVASFRFTR